MRFLPLVVIGAVAAFASGASAQTINLTGTYRCIQDCRDGYLGAPACQSAPKFDPAYCLI